MWAISKIYKRCYLNKVNLSSHTLSCVDLHGCRIWSSSSCWIKRELMCHSCPSEAVVIFLVFWSAVNDVTSCAVLCVCAVEGVDPSCINSSLRRAWLQQRRKQIKGGHGWRIFNNNKKNCCCRISGNKTAFTNNEFVCPSFTLFFKKMQTLRLNTLKLFVWIKLYKQLYYLW